LRCFVVIGGDRHPAAIAPRGSGHVGGRPRLQQFLDLGHHRPPDLLADRDQSRRRRRSVLGLAEEIGGDQARVGAVVGDHEDLGRAGQQIDADAAEQLALGLGDIGVAGPHKHVDGRHAVNETERHRSQCLHPAQAHHRVSAGSPHRVEHRRMDPPVALGRGTGDHVLHTGDLGHADRHER
jgi:hypothetical protein